MNKKKILFISPYPIDEAPSQRFRYEQYLPILKEKEFIVSHNFFLTSKEWKLLYRQGKSIQKFIILLKGLLLRTSILYQSVPADFIFIHREVCPVGPPIFEWLLSRILRKLIIYDFDDAIWLTDKTSESRLEKLLRWRSKVKQICKWSYRVSCGNEYLCEFARQFNKNVVLSPTTIDTMKTHHRAAHQEKFSDRVDRMVVIGWTGSHSTLKYLEELQPVLKQLEEKYAHVSFLVIADLPPSLQLKNLAFKPWSKETEISDLAQADIGIMPLPDNEWAKGKCGFKALQYMALEIPCLASPIGVNTSIIQHGINGFLCSSTQEWLTYFDLLITNESLRNQAGKEGRVTVEKNYSLLSNSSNFLSLFDR